MQAQALEAAVSTRRLKQENILVAAEETPLLNIHGQWREHFLSVLEVLMKR